MSRTDRQLGSPEGGYCCDPQSFGNPGQSGGCEGQADHRAATDPQFTTTSDNAEFMAKSSAGPRVGDLKGVNKVVGTPRSNIENYGK